MKTAKLLSIAFFSVLAFTACKKDDAAGTTNATLQKLQAKWSLDKDIYHEHYAGSPDYRDTTYASAGDYADFRTDGKVYYKFGMYLDTASYSLIADNKLVLGYGGLYPSNDTMNITVLTGNQMQLYMKVFDPAPDYYEDTQYFVK